MVSSTSTAVTVLGGQVFQHPVDLRFDLIGQQLNVLAGEPAPKAALLVELVVLLVLAFLAHAARAIHVDGHIQAFYCGVVEQRGPDDTGGTFVL